MTYPTAVNGDSRLRAAINNRRRPNPRAYMNNAEKMWNRAYRSATMPGAEPGAIPIEVCSLISSQLIPVQWGFCFSGQRALGIGLMTKNTTQLTPYSNFPV